MRQAQQYAALDEIRYRDWWISTDYSYSTGRLNMRWAFEAPCSIQGGAKRKWYGRWWDITDMTTDAVVKTALAALRVVIEHEMMELFKYRGVALFNPHTPIAALMAAQEVAP